MVRPALLALLLTLAWPLAARAEMYKYTDKAGTLHFTDSWEKIPPQYRNQVKPPADPAEVPASPAEEPERSGLNTYQSTTAAPDEDAVREQHKKMRDLKKENCTQQTETLKKRLSDTMARYQEWAENDRQKGKIGESPGWISCSTGNARECIKNKRDHVEKQEKERLDRSPYASQIETLKVQIKKLEKECR